MGLKQTVHMAVTAAGGRIKLWEVTIRFYSLFKKVPWVLKLVPWVFIEISWLFNEDYYCNDKLL